MRFSKYFLILLLYFNVIDPSISLLQMKDLYSVLKVEKNFFSPIYGLILSETSYLKNLYEFGDETSPIVKLVKELFFIHHDQVTFDRTYSPFKPATFFTPEIIGQLVGHIENYKQDSSENNKNSIKKIINSLVFEDVEQRKIKPSINNKIDKFIQRIISRIENEENTLESSISKLKEKLKTGLQGTRQEKQQQIEKINKEIKVLKQKLQSATDRLTVQKSIKSDSNEILKYLLINTNQLIDSIFSSIEQENITIFENHTIFLFLTFLWKIASTKEDFVKYFESLRNTLQEKSIFKNPDFLAKEKEAFLSSIYTKEDYFSFLNHIDQLNFNDFEKLIFVELGANLYENFFPKYIRMKGKVKYKGEIFPDCGETALLNFFNALLFDYDSKNFNVSILEKLGAKQSIIDFYKKYKNNSLLSDTLELHSDWAEVVSGLPNIEYYQDRQEKCEIRAGLTEDSGLNNFLNVIKELIFPNENMPSELVLEKLKTRLEEIESTVKINKVEIIKTEESIKVCIDLINQFNNFFELKLTIFSDHFDCFFVKKLKEKDQLIKVISNFRQFDKFTIQFMMFTSLIVIQFQMTDFDRVVWRNIQSLCSSIFYYYEFFLLFSTTFTNYFKISFIVRVLTNKYLTHLNNKYKKDLVKKLYLSLPEDKYIQTYFWSQVFCHTKKENNLKEFFNFKELSDFQKVMLIEVIFNPPKKDFFDIVKNVLNTLPENEQINIIELILQRNYQYFIPFIRDSIRIEDENNIAKLIQFIILYEKEELFSHVRKNIDRVKKRDEISLIVQYILMQPFKVIQEFYPFVIDNLPKIKNDTLLTYCILGILQSDEKVKRFFPFLKELISKIKKEYNKYILIHFIINIIKRQDDKIQKVMKRAGLYDWAIKNIDSIVSQSNKNNILYAIVDADPKVMKEEGFYDWVAKNRNSFSDEDKIKIDNWIEKYSGNL